MKTSRRVTAVVMSLLFVLTSSPAWSQEKPQEKIDQQTLEMIGKIRYEGFHNSKIMEIATGLMEEIGPRLTGSPNMKKANDWTRRSSRALAWSTPSWSRGPRSDAAGPVSTSTCAW